MSNLADIREFFVAGEDAKNHLLLHFSTLETQAEEDLVFFAFVEIYSKDKDTLKSLQTLIQEVQIALNQSITEDLGKPLESVIETINRLHPSPEKTFPKNMAFVIGTLRGVDLSFCYRGTPAVSVINPNKKSWHNLVDDKEENSPQKLFPEILEGKITNNQILLFTTKNCLEIIKEHSDDLPLLAKDKFLADSLEKLCKKHGKGSYCGGVFIRGELQKKTKQSKGKSQTKQKIPKPVQTKKSSTKTQKINKKQAAQNPSTQRIQRIDSRNKKQKGRLIPKIKPRNTTHLNQTFKQSLAKESALNRILIMFGKSLSFLALKFVNIFVSLWRALVSSILFVTNRGGYRQVLIRNISDDIYHKKKAVRDLPTLNKIIFVCIIILTGLFIVSLTHLRIKKNNEIRNQVYENSRVRITNNLTNTKDIAVYDKERSFALLEQIKTEIESLTEENPYKVSLTKSHRETVEEVQNMTKTKSNIFVDFSQTLKTGKPTRLHMADDKLIAYGEDERNIFIVDRDTTDVSSVELDSNIHLKSVSSADEGSLVFYVEGGTLAILDPKTKIFSLTNFEVRKRAITTDIFFYNEKIYSTDIEKKQVYKHNQTQTGYDRGSEWLSKEELLFSSSTSITVDGNVFVLTGDGHIFKYSRSQPDEDFELKGLNPPLKSGADIWSSPVWPYIYMLDPTEKRVISLTKQGRFVAQYTDDAWINPTSLAVDADRNTGYVISEGKVYSFELE